MITGVNGNTITKLKYPERQLYYKTYDEPAKRRRQIDEYGQVINEGQFTAFGIFKDDDYNHITVDNFGDASYTNEQARRLKINTI